MCVREKERERERVCEREREREREEGGARERKSARGGGVGDLMSVPQGVLVTIYRPRDHRPSS